MSKKTAPKDTPNLAKDGPEKARPTSHREKVMFDQLDRIEAAISKVHEELLSVRSIAHHARTAARVNTSKLDIIQRDLLEARNAIITETNAIDETVDTILASLSQPTVEQAEPQPESLRPGDYTDASKEVADALTAMGWGWYDADRDKLRYITWGKHEAHLGFMVNMDGKQGDYTYHTPAELLSRASVTAKDLGLVPVVPWVPEVGQWIKPVDGSWQANTYEEKLAMVKSGPDQHGHYLSDYPEFYFTPNEVRPATEQEIAAHLAEQEAKKPVEFGTRVEYDGREWIVVSHKPDKFGYSINRATDGNDEWRHDLPRHEFTVIDQP